jgi:hypothetical protein
MGMGAWQAAGGLLISAKNAFSFTAYTPVPSESAQQSGAYDQPAFTSIIKFLV